MVSNYYRTHVNQPDLLFFSTQYDGWLNAYHFSKTLKLQLVLIISFGGVRLLGYNNLGNYSGIFQRLRLPLLANLKRPVQFCDLFHNHLSNAVIYPKILRPVQVPSYRAISIPSPLFIALTCFSILRLV